MPVMRHDVEFKSGSVICRAWLYEPDPAIARPAPCVVMAHGLGGTRRDSLEPYAERFCENGFFVLLFDYRHLGDSDGVPRQIVSIPLQIEDWSAAIMFVRQHKGINPQRIGLWGTSLSGGHVIAVAANDPGIAAISAQCPMMDGRASTHMARRACGLQNFMRLGYAAFIDALRSLFGLSPTYVPIVAPPGELAAMASEDAYGGYTKLTHPGWRNETAARLFLRFPFYRPVSYAKAIKCPSIILVCLKDSVTSPRAGQDVAARMGDKARLVKLPIGHFDVYKGEWFDKSSEEQTNFFKRVLLA